MPGERRQLTVFFGDLVDSTALAERWDPEQLHELYSQYQSACAEVTRRYDGHIAHFLGDGIVAFFGYPVAHEDDAVRAVRSGLEIVERVGRISVGGERLHLRVAIHTGLVVVGDVGGSDGGEQMVLGEVPNVAARLQGEAEPDTVVVSDATRRLIEGHFELKDLGPRSIRGLSRQIRVFQVIGDDRVESHFDASDSTPFTGRKREAEAILGFVERAEQGGGQALLLCGEAGIGKSRLLDVALDAAQVRGHAILAAQCSPYHTNSAFHPIRKLLERRLGLVRGQTPARRLELLEEAVADRPVPAAEAVPLLASLLSIPLAGSDPEADGRTPAMRRERTLQLLIDLLLHPPGAPAVLLAVEDLHWADPSTLDLVKELVRHRPTAPVLLVLTTRSDPSEVPEIARGCTVLEVGALPDAEARALIAGVTGGKILPAEITRQILERTGGVPLHIEAVTRTIIESGGLEEHDDRFEAVGTLPPGLIPATIHDSLMARIDRLGPDKPVVQLAAVIGKDFDFELLRGLADRDDAGLKRALQRMVRLGLVSRTGVPPRATYTFRHALVQDAAYESLLRKTRQEFHARIAAVLSREFRDATREAPELLARHYEGAGMIEKAIDEWTAAGVLAQQRSAERECVAYLRKVIALLRASPGMRDAERDRREMTALLALAPALMATQGWASREVEAACTRARELCERAGNGEGLLASLWGTWTVRFVRGELDRALEAGESVLAMALASENRILHVVARQGVGFTRYFRGEFRAAREQGERAIDLFDLEQERALVRTFQIPSSVVCLAFLSQSLRFMGYPDRAERRHREMLELVDVLENPACTAVGLGVGMYRDYDVRDLEAIATKASRGYAMSLEGGFELWAASMQVYSGWARSLGGDTASGLPELRAGLEAYRGTGAGLATSAMMMMLGEALRIDGQSDAALDAIESALRIADAQNERYFAADLHRVKAEILIERGGDAEGEANLRRAIDIARSQEARLLELRSALALARLLAGQERREEARAVLRPRYDWFTEGHGTRELVESRVLLAELEGVPA
jgi:class 3 adenylate cyclase/predicted ATPase